MVDSSNLCLLIGCDERTTTSDIDASFTPLYWVGGVCMVIIRFRTQRAQAGPARTNEKDAINTARFLA